MPAVTLKYIYGRALAGALSETQAPDDAVGLLPFQGTAGVLASCYIYDSAIFLFGSTLSGSLAGGEISGSGFVWSTFDFYGQSLCGAVLSARLKSEYPPPLPIFLFDSQAQPSGSKLGQGQASGAIE